MLKISRVVKGLIKEKMTKYDWHLACIKYGLKGIDPGENANKDNKYTENEKIIRRKSFVDSNPNIFSSEHSS